MTNDEIRDILKKMIGEARLGLTDMPSEEEGDVHQWTEVMLAACENTLAVLEWPGIEDDGTLHAAMSAFFAGKAHGQRTMRKEIASLEMDILQVLQGRLSGGQGARQGNRI